MDSPQKPPENPETATDLKKRVFLKSLVDRLPREPGVYLMKDREGTVIYVGKAKNLRSRVRSYLVPGSDGRPSIPFLERALADIEVVVTASEKEALILENDLIKRHQPRYNIRLRDDKDFLFLRLDPDAAWPRMDLVRRKAADRGRLFGPYSSAHAARETARIVQRRFQLRSCSDRVFASRKRPCLQHQMGRCMAPCSLPVDPAEYRRNVAQACLFLSGREEELIWELERLMDQASRDLVYEKAAVYRDRLRSIQTTLEPQAVAGAPAVSRDVIGAASDEGRVEIALVPVRCGRMLEPILFGFSLSKVSLPELVSSFAVQYYSAAEPPPEVTASVEIEDRDALAEWLGEKRGKQVRVFAPPSRGWRRAQADLAVRNAEEALSRRREGEKAALESLNVIAAKLHLKGRPRRMECLDISHLGGTLGTAAVAVMIDGEIAPSSVRRFQLRKAEGGDDYAAMKEVLGRRFKRAGQGEPGWELPDLFLVDGGKGQLAAALEVFSELKIEGTALAAVAKARDDGSREEQRHDRIFLPNRKNPVPIRASSPLLLLARLRDEAHRQAHGYQVKRRRKSIGTELTNIPGIGPHLARRLLSTFGSLEAIRTASLEDLSGVPGIGPALAGSIRTRLADQETP